MSPQEVMELKKLIVYVAEYYGRDLKPQTVALMASDLEDLPLSEVKQAYSNYRRDGKNDRFPIPGVIREIVRPTVSKKGAAVEAAARIISAINQFGWNNSQLAREYIGELGWRVVEMQGGWIRQCQSTDPTGVLQAQWTRLAESILERRSAGITEPTGLPGKQEQQQQIGARMSRLSDLLPNRTGE